VRELRGRLRSSLCVRLREFVVAAAHGVLVDHVDRVPGEAIQVTETTLRPPEASTVF